MSYPELIEARKLWRYQPPNNLLKGRVVLVTGAGGGIGRAAARTFAHYGADLLLLGRTTEKLEEVCDLIAAETKTDPTIVPCDLEHAGTENFQELAEATLGHYGRLDGLLHNASRLGQRVPLEHYDDDEWRRVLRINLEAPAALTRALLPALRKSASPRIVFTSSSVGRKPRAYWGAYAISKAAVEALASMLAQEHEHECIRVTTLDPGATRTDMRAHAYPGEQPSTVAPPEQRMDLYLYLMGADAGANWPHAVDARDWTP